MESIFTKPQSYEVLPYLNSYNKENTPVLTGFFVPSFTCLPDFMDKRGVTNEIEAKKYYDNIRKTKSSDPQNFLQYCSEYCYYPQEALSRKGENQFDQVKISEQLTKVQNLTDKENKPIRGYLSYNYKDNTDEVIGVRFTRSENGPIIVSEEPLLDDLNQPIKNLYIAGIDSIDHAEDDSVVGDKGSKFCITIKKRTFGNSGNKYVCMYIERPHSVKTAYENALKILMWYGCKANLEDTKIGFRQWLTGQKLHYKYLMQRPVSATSNIKRNNNLWGTPGSEKMIKHGLELVSQFIDDFYYTIDIEEILIQMQNFSYAMKGSYDIILALCYTEIADEDMVGVLAKKENSLTEWEECGQDIGFYIDDRGYKQFGIIP